MRGTAEVIDRAAHVGFGAEHHTALQDAFLHAFGQGTEIRAHGVVHVIIIGHSASPQAKYAQGERAAYKKTVRKTGR